MPFVQAKCPNCGGILNVDNSHDAAVCQFCNTPYVVEKAITNYNNTFKIDNATINVAGMNIDNLNARARQYEEQGNIIKAVEYYNKVLDIDIHNTTAIEGLKRLDINDKGLIVFEGYELSNEQYCSIVNFIEKDHDLINAIKRFRECTGAGLAEAKTAVDNYSKKHNIVYPKQEAPSVSYPINENASGFERLNQIAIYNQYIIKEEKKRKEDEWRIRAHEEEDRFANYLYEYLYPYVEKTANSVIQNNGKPQKTIVLMNKVVFEYKKSPYILQKYQGRDEPIYSFIRDVLNDVNSKFKTELNSFHIYMEAYKESGWLRINHMIRIEMKYGQ